MAKIEHKKICVIIPTRDRPELLRKCIESLIQQSYTNFEVIISNDGGITVDKNSSYIKRLSSIITAKNIIVINNAKHRGHATVRNEAVKKAKGDIIVFTDDDAIAQKDWLASINHYFQKHPTVAAVNGKIEAVSTATSSERIRQAYYDYRDIVYGDGLLDGYYKKVYALKTQEKNLCDWLSLGNCAIQKKFIDKKNLFDQSMELNYGRKLGKDLLKHGHLVTYSQNPVIRHHHGRTIKILLTTRVKNGINFCNIDDDEKKNHKERFSEGIRYFRFVYGNKNLLLTDKILELIYTNVFMWSYLSQKIKNSL